MTVDSYIEFSESDIRDLRIAKSRLEHPGLAARLADLIGKPIDQGLKALPAGLNKTAVEIARKALLRPDSQYGPWHRQAGSRPAA
jgi:hypothetical protein